MKFLIVSHFDLTQKEMIISDLIKRSTDEKEKTQLLAQYKSVVNLLSILNKSVLEYCRTNGLECDPNDIEGFVQSWIQNQKEVA